jgi:hypothetical protein
MMGSGKQVVFCEGRSCTPIYTPSPVEEPIEAHIFDLGPAQIPRK